MLAVQQSIAPLSLVWGSALWLGGLPALEQLDAHHIDAVVTVLPKSGYDVERLSQSVGAQRDHLWLDYRDAPDVPLSEAFALSGAWIHERLGQGKRVLVHCAAGMSRSATIVAAYLLHYHGDQFPSVAAVIAYLRERRPIVRPNAGFLAQLEGLR